VRVKVDCYLLRDDGEWYELGNVSLWSTAFSTFPGPADQSVVLTTDDIELLALRLDDYGHDPTVLTRLATDIVRWAQGKRFRFRTELDPQIERDVAPTPITGSARSFLA
jgi:hypothetical protein